MCSHSDATLHDAYQHMKTQPSTDWETLLMVPIEWTRWTLDDEVCINTDDTTIEKPVEHALPIQLQKSQSSRSVAKVTATQLPRRR